ncbi:MAG: class I SAM-dependent methyltransferase [Alphaproteobacteria bacterium]|nr:class I SAM-dependent methyltransferase [Alphaproteobacteria bacterium]
MTYTDGNKVHIAKDQSKGRMLDVYARISEFVVGHSYLHWGYWENPDQPGALTLVNLAVAQRAFLDKLVTLIPPGVKSIIDIGSGTGELAAHLQAAGYDVTCVCPSIEQNRLARTKLAAGTVIHESTFEDLAPDRAYDLAIFCESFQYVALPQAIEKLAGCARHVLIADYFKISADSRQGGGFSWQAFESARAQYGYDVVSHVDITRNVKPNLLYKRRLYLDLLLPLTDAFSERLRQRHPLISRLFLGRLRNRIVGVERMRRKGETADPEKLVDWIQYCMILMRRND